MYSTIYLGRQPIVDVNQRRVAYELLFRSGPENRALFQDDVNATASVIRHAFVDLGLDRVLEGGLGFVNVNERLLKSPVIDLLPADRIVIEILEGVPLDESVRERCGQLRQRGYRFALDDIEAITPEVAAMLPLVDVLKFDLRRISLAALPAMYQQARAHGFRGQILGEKVDSVEEFEACRAVGMTLFQGYFFARPTVLSHNRAHPNRTLTLRLLGLVMQGAELAELEAVFKGAPDMVVGLLKLVNAAEHYRRPVGSIREALMTLGTQRLKRWALIILFAADCRPSQGPSPLLELAAVRGRMMELLAEEAGVSRDAAFMTGILSLADSLMAMPMAELTAGLALEPQVLAALLHRQGALGELLEQVILSECHGPDAALPSLDAERFNTLQLQAMAWVQALWSDDFVA